MTKKKEVKEETEEKVKEEILVEKEEKKITKTEAQEKKLFDKDSWNPKTMLGKKVKEGQIINIDSILDSGQKILEPEIVDALVPELKVELLMIGQSKGKFGGGQRRVFKQTQKKTREGNKPKFATMAVVGDHNGHVGIGYGKAKETVPAREKAIRMAKLSIIKITRGCGSWQCICAKPHSIPFKVSGKCGSVITNLMPAPKGTGLCIEKECKKILSLAGIEDVWSTTLGQTKTKINLINACIGALCNLTNLRVQSRFKEKLGIIGGIIPEEKNG